jgi:RNA polymerase sigma factor (sigma-70 family)
LTEEELIARCKRQERLAQKLVYEKYAGRMFGLCKRYVKTTENAEEVLMEGFCKVFQKIDMYSGTGSFEGWIRRIMTNEALMFIRRDYKFNDHVDIQDIQMETFDVTIEEKLIAADLIKLLDQLPVGYRTVFNLYVMEGYKHREIADMLQISINTSKSQLILAKRKLKDLIEQKIK